MNKATLTSFWDHFRTVQGITVRCVEAIPKDKIDARPCKDMRTPKELVTHMYAMMRYVTDGTAKGRITYDDTMDPPELAKIKSHDDLVRYARESWQAADRTVQSLTDAQLAAIVPTAWGGMSFPGWVCVSIIYDEHLHHRGQLYAFLRQLGVEPPFLWDFENNAPEYRPKQAQQA